MNPTEIMEIVTIAGIRISVAGNDLDVRSDRPLTVAQFNFLKQHKARLLAELKIDDSLELVDIVARIDSDQPTCLIEYDNGTIDPEFYINSACQGLPVNSDWVRHYVVDKQDIEDIKKGDLPLSCLRAHVEYHLGVQLKWHELRHRINQNDNSTETT